MRRPPAYPEVVLSALLDVLLPVVIVASVGVLLGRRFELRVDTLSKVGLYGLTPALAFDSMMNTQLNPAVGVRLVIAYVLASAVAGAASWILAARHASPTRRAITASTVLGNNGNFGLPIALLAFGNEGLEMAVVIFIASLVIMFTAGPLLLGARGGVAGGLRTVATLPVTWALALAGLFRLLGWSFPQGITAGIELLGQAAIPLILVQLGIQIGTSGRVAFTRPVLSAVGQRIILVPLAAAGCGLLLGLSGLALASLVLAAAMPIAVNTLLLAQEYEGDADTVASAVVISTFAAVPLLMVLIAALPALVP